MEGCFRWIESSILNSIKPKREELKILLTSVNVIQEIKQFLKNDETHRLFAYFTQEGSLKISIHPPELFHGKMIVFVADTLEKITAENINEHVSYQECTENVFEGMEKILREIYIPLLCSQNHHQSSEIAVIADHSRQSTLANSQGALKPEKLLDVLHRLVFQFGLAQSESVAEITLPMPQMEILQEIFSKPSQSSTKTASALHVMESTVVTWMKIIKNLLIYDPISSLVKQWPDQGAGLLHEITLWKHHEHEINSVLEQLTSTNAQQVLQSLNQCQSQYHNAMQRVIHDLNEKRLETEELLVYLSPLEKWTNLLNGMRRRMSFNNDDLNGTMSLHAMSSRLGSHLEEDDLMTPLPVSQRATPSVEEDESSYIVRHIPPLMHIIFLLWKECKHYHDPNNLRLLLRLFANDISRMAMEMVGEDIVNDPLTAHYKLRSALKICSAFRVAYLNVREKANEINAVNMAVNEEKLRHMPREGLWQSRVYGAHAYRPPYGMPSLMNSELVDRYRIDELHTESVWPPRNDDCFKWLNLFIERCNDCMELSETAQHFHSLSYTAAIGGAGTMSLDVLVAEIHKKYEVAINRFLTDVQGNVLDLHNPQIFEKAFFHFRTSIKELESTLGTIIREVLSHAPNLMARLRLLHVFEGMGSRDIIRETLKQNDEEIVMEFSRELTTVENLYENQHVAPPALPNLPPLVCALFWCHGMMERIRMPMDKIKHLCPHVLSGDSGRELRHKFAAILSKLQNFRDGKLNKWNASFTDNILDVLKQPLLVINDTLVESEDDDGGDSHVSISEIRVNMDPSLILLMNEIQHIQQEPFCIALPAPARKLQRQVNLFELRVAIARLETICDRYNYALKSLSAYERPLLERHLTKIEELLEQGLSSFTWRLDESQDFIEKANVLVTQELCTMLDCIQGNYNEISELITNWSQGGLDVFSQRSQDKTYEIEEMLELQNNLIETTQQSIRSTGQRIHNLINNILQTVQISQVSPSWLTYVEFMDAVVLQAMTQGCIASFQSLLMTLEEPSDMGSVFRPVPLLRVRMELVNCRVLFLPPLHIVSNAASVSEFVMEAIKSFYSRGQCMRLLGDIDENSSPPRKEDDLHNHHDDNNKEEKNFKGGHQDKINILDSTFYKFLEVDPTLQALSDQAAQFLHSNLTNCEQLLKQFDEFEFLWSQDAEKTFKEFLMGRITPHQSRSNSQARIKQANITLSRATSRASTSEMSHVTPDQETRAERSFLTPANQGDIDVNVPSLEEFKGEMEIYKSAREEIQSLSDYEDVGWIRISMEPIKQVLITLASKHIWIFCHYLIEQVSTMLTRIEEFLIKMEPELESIGSNLNIQQHIQKSAQIAAPVMVTSSITASLMHFMRTFNEISYQQQDVESKFLVMHRTVNLLQEFKHPLDGRVAELYDIIPTRWTQLRAKMSLAKQRLGPKIQEYSDAVIQDLAEFLKRLLAFQEELVNSEVYSWECSIENARITLESFGRRLILLENESQDFEELQNLLEVNIVDFSIIINCRREVDQLKLVWQTVQNIFVDQTSWKRYRWRRINATFLLEICQKHMLQVETLPAVTRDWNVTIGVTSKIEAMQNCLPLVEKLNNPAMRTRHWKQLVRATGGIIQVDNRMLKKMTFGELYELGLHEHLEEVAAVVARAEKDLNIEQSLKTYEEVWLSKIFDLKRYPRLVPHARIVQKHGAGSIVGGSRRQSVLVASLEEEAAQNRTQAIISSNAALGDSASVASMPPSLTQAISIHSAGSITGGGGGGGANASSTLGGGGGGQTHTSVGVVIFLLHNCESLFQQLKEHQEALTGLSKTSVAGSFVDDVVKWQKTLKNIEEVLRLWLRVQNLWIEVEETFHAPEIANELPKELQRFRQANETFHLLMKATQRNTNVLQCCNRKNILVILEQMNTELERNRAALLNYVDRCRHEFPRFYFLSKEDILHVVGYASNIEKLNEHITKLFPHIGALIYRPTSEDDWDGSEIIGIRSTMGEPMFFKKAISCRGRASQWLPHIIDAIKQRIVEKLGNLLVTPQESKKVMEDEASALEKVNEEGGATNEDEEPAAAAGTEANNVSHRPSLARTTGGGNNRQAGSRVQSSTSYVSSIRGGRAASVTAEDHTGEMNEDYALAKFPFSFILSEPGNKTIKEDFTPVVTPDHPLAWLVDEPFDVVFLLLSVLFTTGIDEAVASTLPQATEMLQTLEKEYKTRIVMVAQLYNALTAQQRGSKPINHPIATEPTTTTGQEETSTNTMGEVDEVTGDSDEIGNTATQKTAGILNKIQKQAPRKSLSPSDPPLNFVLLQQKIIRAILHKLSSTLGVMHSHLGIVRQLISVTSSSNDLSVTQALWTQQIRYVFPESRQQLFVQCANAQFLYGFEFTGSCVRENLFSHHLWPMNNALNAIAAMRGVICASDKDKSPSLFVEEMAKLTGNACFTVDCIHSMEHESLANAMRGVATTGAWLCLHNVNRLPPDVMGAVVDMSNQFFASLQNSTTTEVSIVGQTLPLYRSTIGDKASSSQCNGAICVTLDRLKSDVRDNNFLLQRMIFSTLTCVPRRMLETFRLVSVPKHSLKDYISSILISNGVTDLSTINGDLLDLIQVLPVIIGNSVDSTSLIVNADQLSDQHISTIINAAIQTWKEMNFGSDEKSATLKVGIEQHIKASLRDNLISHLANESQQNVLNYCLNRIFPEEGARNNSMAFNEDDDPEAYHSELKEIFDDGQDVASVAPSNRRLDSTLAGKMNEITHLLSRNGFPVNLFLCAKIQELLYLKHHYRSVMVVGPPGCGKTTITNMAIAALEKECGTRVSHARLYPGAVDDDDFTGSHNQQTGQWKPGQLQCVLNNIINQEQQQSTQKVARTSHFVTIDGMCSLQQVEAIYPLIGGTSNESTILVGNGQRYLIPENFHLIWELESLEHLHPGLIPLVAVLMVNENCVTWKNLLQKFLRSLNSTAGQMLSPLLTEYFPQLIRFFNRTCCSDLLFDSAKEKYRLHQVTPQNILSCVRTSLAYLQALLTSAGSVVMSRCDYELILTYSCIWGFGGNLTRISQQHLSQWWKETFNPQIPIPTEGSLFDYSVDLDKMEYSSWWDQCPPQYTPSILSAPPTSQEDQRNKASGTMTSAAGGGGVGGGGGSGGGTGGSNQHTDMGHTQWIHTARTQALYYNMNLLNDAGHPVALIGPWGCGLTGIIQEREKATCSGEVAEYLSMTVNCTRLVSSRTLRERLNEKLTWRYSNSYSPVNNKRLLCIVDDLNLSRPRNQSETDTDENASITMDLISRSANRSITAVEFIRELVDNGGYFDVNSQTWRQVRPEYLHLLASFNSSYIQSPPTNVRFLRHFHCLAVHYPDVYDQCYIYSNLLRRHFITPIDPRHQKTLEGKLAMEKAEQFSRLIDRLVRVTIDLQERLRGMFLPVASRSHYIFSMRTLSSLFHGFRRSCNSLTPINNILALWRNECNWTFSERMIDSVDKNRYQRAYVASVKKEFAEEYRLSDDLMEILLRRRPPLCSNIFMHESGVVSAGPILRSGSNSANTTQIDKDNNQITNKSSSNTQNNEKSTSSGAVGSSSSTMNSSSIEGTDGYQPCHDLRTLRGLLAEAVEEYNKVNPRIAMPLFECRLKDLSRMARCLQLPNNQGHLCLLTDGSPGQAYFLLRLAAHLGHFRVFLPTPTSDKIDRTKKISLFESDLKSAYKEAGIKKTRTLFILRDYELIAEDFLGLLTEFVVHGDINHLFTLDEQLAIVNSLRTEVIQSGLSYSRDVAWNFFLKRVQLHFRLCFVVTRTREELRVLCRDYPSLFGSIKQIWFAHWGKHTLVDHAHYFLMEHYSLTSIRDTTHFQHHKLNINFNWLSPLQKESIAHLLADMHLAVASRDGGEQMGGQQYRHINNTTFQFFIDKFCKLLHQHYANLQSTHSNAYKALQKIREEGRLARRLYHQLQQERIVLTERAKAADRLLTQIGQDTAITETQMRTVVVQNKRLIKLKKLMPQYQEAHERAAYKAIAMVNEAKKAVQSMDLDSLADLRSTNKVPSEVEDLLAAIIIILKSPHVDLTWSKGAKRQMANLERFMEELMTFDERQLSYETLQVVRPYLQKPGLDSEESILIKHENLACGSLCKWLHHVVNYHVLMHTRVRPLHDKMNETNRQMEEAEQKMRSLESKRKALETRLQDLSKSFEDATIDKNNQDEKTLKMDEMLHTAARLRRLMAAEYRRLQLTHDSIDREQEALIGWSALAAAFTVYLGPYSPAQRRLLLTYDWPRCLRERGLPHPLALQNNLDDSDNNSRTSTSLSDYGEILNLLDGKKVETTEVNSSPPAPLQEEGDTEKTEDNDSKNEEEEEEKNEKSEDVTSQEQETTQATEEKSETAASRTASETENNPKKSSVHEIKVEDEPPYDWEGGDEMTPRQYINYIQALLTFLIGEDHVRLWQMNGFSCQQMENAAIMLSSTRRPPFLIDPYAIGVEQLCWMLKNMENSINYGDSTEIPRLTSDANNSRAFVEVDMSSRWTEPEIPSKIEEALVQGHPLLLKNCSHQFDNFIEPMIHHRNMSEPVEETRMIRFGTRRILCHPLFLSFFATKQALVTYTSDVSSSTCLINYTLSADSLTDDLLQRAFALVMPKIARCYSITLGELEYWKRKLNRGTERLHTYLTDSVNIDRMWSTDSQEKMAELVNELETANKNLLIRQASLKQMEEKKHQLVSIATHASRLYCLLKAMNKVESEYHVSLRHFLILFDQSLKGIAEGRASQCQTTMSLHQNLNQEVSHQNTSVSLTSGKRKISVEQTDGEKQDALADDVETKSQEILSGDDNDRHFLEMVRLGREEAQRMEVMSEITGRRNQRKSNNQIGVEKYFIAQGVMRPQSLAPNLNLKNQTSQQLGLKTDSYRLRITTNANSETQTDSEIDAIDSTSDSKIVQKAHDEITRSVIMLAQRLFFKEDFTVFQFYYRLSLWWQEEIGRKVQQAEIDFFLKDTSQPEQSMGGTAADSVVPKDQKTLYWLSSSLWSDLIQLSLASPSLMGLADHVKENVEAWKQWFKLDHPEMQPSPWAQSHGGSNIDNNDRMSVKQWHKLLIIRALREDRLPQAIIKGLPEEKQQISANNNLIYFDYLDALLNPQNKNAFHTVLIIEPASVPKSTNHMMAMFPYTSVAESIVSLGKKNGQECRRLQMNRASNSSLQAELDTALETYSWLILEDVHLASSSSIELLSHYTNRVSNNQDGQFFCLWMISALRENFMARLPRDMHEQILVLNCQGFLKEGKNNKDRHDHLPSDENVKPTTTEEEEDEITEKESAENNENSPTDDLFRNALETSFSILPKSNVDDMFQLKQIDPTRREYFVAICYLNAILLARANIGTRGVATWKQFSSEVIHEALDVLLEVEDIHDLEISLMERIYKKLYFNAEDSRMICQFLHQLLQTVSLGKDSFSFGGVEYALPSYEIATNSMELQKWFTQADENVSVRLLQLESETLRIWLNRQSVHFLHISRTLFNSENDPNLGIMSYDIDDVTRQIMSISTLKLRAVLDYCLERLPPIIDSIKINNDQPLDRPLDKLTYDFPYHRSSVVNEFVASQGGRRTSSNNDSDNSVSLISSSISVGHVLLMEVLYFNRQMCLTRDWINRLMRFCLTGPHSIPRHWRKTAEKLCKEQVPLEWVEVEEIPTVHNVISWLQHKRRCHTQLTQWIQRGLISLGDGPTGKEHFDSVWLGGLYRPRALFLALMYEYSLAVNTSMDQLEIRWQPILINQKTAVDNDKKEFRLLLKDIHIVGARVDPLNGQLSLEGLEGSLSKCPLSEMVIAKKSENASKDGQTSNKYICPLVRSFTRMVTISNLIIEVPHNLQEVFDVHEVYLMTDEGALNQEDPLRGKIPIIHQNLQQVAALTTRALLNLPSERSTGRIAAIGQMEDDVILDADDQDLTTVTDRNENLSNVQWQRTKAQDGQRESSLKEDDRSTLPSEQASQLSYRPYSPKDQQRPLYLQLHKETPLVTEPASQSDTTQRSTDSFLVDNTIVEMPIENNADEITNNKDNEEEEVKKVETNYTEKDETEEDVTEIDETTELETTEQETMEQETTEQGNTTTTAEYDEEDEEDNTQTDQHNGMDTTESSDETTNQTTARSIENEVSDSQRSDQI